MAKRSGRALVLGLGSSGLAAARLLHQQGWRVDALDEKNAPAAAQPESAIAQRSAELTHSAAGSYDLAVVSPGIPAGHVWLNRLAEKGVPVFPEFEYGCAAMSTPRMVAVTGSNGKSSVVKWIADTLTLAGIPATPAANYGTPVCDIARQPVHPRVLVLELSSFQLEQSVDFSPAMAILLNLTPNHLDRHPSMAHYIKAKSRLFGFPKPGMISLVHAPAWPLIRPYVEPALRPLQFGDAAAMDYGVDGTTVYSRASGLRVDLASTWWGRWPLLINAAAALAVFEAWRIPAELIRRSAGCFEPLPHRLEMAGEKNGVRFINDSKCSTLTALAAALSSGSSGNHLIAGGILKEADLDFLKELLAEKCVFVYCIGQAAEKMVRAWGDAVSCENCVDLNNAFSRAAAKAVAGQTVLLSPGCSSFDQFPGYAQRGNSFKALVAAHVNAGR